MNRKKVGLVSLGTGGTAGHMKILTGVMKSLVERGIETFCISEYEYQSKTELDHPLIHWKRVSQQKHQQSLAGLLNHKSSYEVINHIEEESIDEVVFSTFFDKDIINHLKSKDKASHLITYPLRDTFNSVFYTFNYDKLFENIFVLQDVSPHSIYSKHGALMCSQPVKTQTSQPYSQNNHILISCGGGGLPSATSFFEIVQSILPYIRKKHPLHSILITTGSDTNQKLLENYAGDPGIEIKKWVTDWEEKVANSDLVINEAGYFSTHELISQGTPGILIPGHRRMDNQELRALYYQKLGLGFCFFPQADITRLKNQINQSLMNNNQRASIAEACHKYNTFRESLPNIYEKVAEKIIK